MKIVLLLATLLLGGFAGACRCHGPVEPHHSLRIVVDTLERAETLPIDIGSVTYQYGPREANPDSLLRVLHVQGIPVKRGWEAIDYMCKDAYGPRFVVELTREDSRMAANDFTPGTGRLLCAARLKRYTLVE